MEQVLYSNATEQMSAAVLSASFQRVLAEFPRALLALLVPTAFLYLAIYSLIKNRRLSHAVFTFISLLAYLACPWITPVHCGPFRSLQHFGVVVGLMKGLDLFARRHSPLRYTASPVPSPWILALLLLTELRYESFTPNHIKVPSAEFSEPIELAKHIGAFAVLQTFPQNWPIVLAFEVLLAIYIIWTTIEVVVRYKTSPPLFGPLYRADSLAGFWSETWHNAFASPVTSLGYTPARRLLLRMGAPVPVAKSVGVLAAFTISSAFHIYALGPMLPRESLVRIGLFFIFNGIATICEAAIWGPAPSWKKTAMAWIFETTLATWVAQTSFIPNGFSNIQWKDMCGPIDQF